MKLMPKILQSLVVSKDITLLRELLVQKVVAQETNSSLQTPLDTVAHTLHLGNVTI
jgi:hypothetical protein